MTVQKVFSGHRLRLHRLARGFAQPDLGELVFVQRHTIATYESGACAPSAAVLGRLAVALDIPVDALFTVSGRDAA